MGEKRYNMNKVATNYFCALFSVPVSQLTTALWGDLNGSDMKHSLGPFTLLHWISVCSTVNDNA